MVKIAHASIDKNGKIHGGKAGDQTGKELCIRNWYNKPWDCVIRFKAPAMREKVAVAMEHAVNNEHIGYDQYQRNTLLIEARLCNYDPACIIKFVETDCSGLVTVACIFAGIPESVLVKNGNCATTSTLKSRLLSTGKVTVYTGIDYTRKTDKLQRGDILLSEGHHVVVVVSTDKSVPKKSVDEVAKEVLQGKWSNGEERKKRLTEAGYDYTEVQAKVKELIYGSVQNIVQTKDIPRYIWNFLYGRIQNPFGVAGLMGNLQAESGLNPKNMQNSYEKKLGMNDESYTKCVDNGTYKHFCDDKVGYGLAQWTSEGRKRGLYSSRNGRSIGDLDMQLAFLWTELTTSYRGVLNGLKVIDSVKEASDLVLTKFERPKNQDASVKSYRASLGQQFYNKYFLGK